METSHVFWSYWYFQIPNYFLAALMYTLIGRFAMSLFAPPDWDHYIWRAFLRLTDWVVRLAGWITPRLVPPPLLMLVAAFWLFVLRLVLALGFALTGLAPRLAAG